MHARYLICLAFSAVSSHILAQQTVSFPVIDGHGRVQADLYGKSERAVLLAHGGRFNKESWKKQALVLEDHGFMVLALRFRGDGNNPDGSPGSFGTEEDNAQDVLAGIRYLHGIGAKDVSAVGGSFGGYAVADADAASALGEIDAIVILASPGGNTPEKLHGRKLFIVAREDRSGDGLRLPDISRSYAKAPDPKKLIVLEGSAHAQFLFDTDQGPRLLQEILTFLSSK